MCCKHLNQFISNIFKYLQHKKLFTRCNMSLFSRKLIQGSDLKELSIKLEETHFPLSCHFREKFAKMARF